MAIDFLYKNYPTCGLGFQTSAAWFVWSAWPQMNVMQISPINGKVAMEQRRVESGHEFDDLINYSRTLQWKIYRTWA